MAVKEVFTRDSISGQVAWVPEAYLDIFPNLEEVPEDTKPRHPELHAETDVDGKNADGKLVRAPKPSDTKDGTKANAEAISADRVNS